MPETPPSGARALGIAVAAANRDDEARSAGSPGGSVRGPAPRRHGIFIGPTEILGLLAQVRRLDRAAGLGLIRGSVFQVILPNRAIFLTLPYVQDTRRRPEKELWRQFELAQPHIFGALLDAVSHGLRTLPEVRLKRLPRMADFALWATACETALWPAGTFLRAYNANRRTAIGSVIEADPVAAGVRDIMAKQTTWTGNASDLLRAGADAFRDDGARRSPGWPKSPRTLAGRLRRAQTSLRTLGIEIAFSREGRAGTRIIRMSASHESPPRKRSVPSAPSAPSVV